MDKVFVQKLEKADYLHLEAWIDSLSVDGQSLEPLKRIAIKQQIVVREQEIFDLEDKLSTLAERNAYLEENVREDKDKLHRRNMLIEKLKKDKKENALLRSVILELRINLYRIRHGLCEISHSPKVRDWLTVNR